MDVRKYWTACRVHDWFYEMAEDPNAYRDGRDNEHHLRRLAEADPRLMEVFTQWEDHFHNCGPRPAEPKMEDAK